MTGIAPVLVPVAAVGVVVLMVGAMVTHLRRGEVMSAAGNLVYLALAAFVAWGRFGPASFIGWPGRSRWLHVDIVDKTEDVRDGAGMAAGPTRSLAGAPTGAGRPAHRRMSGAVAGSDRSGRCPGPSAVAPVDPRRIRVDVALVHRHRSGLYEPWRK